MPPRGRPSTPRRFLSLRARPAAVAKTPAGSATGEAQPSAPPMPPPPPPLAPGALPLLGHTLKSLEEGPNVGISRLLMTAIEVLEENGSVEPHLVFRVATARAPFAPPLW